jgi:ABC-2 type transport system ATP-binding protein
MIAIHGFRKAYDGLIAVNDLHLEVQPGEIWGLLGPNGAGKTTTLRALAGIIAPSHGSLNVAGFDVERQAQQAKRCLAYVADDPQLFSELTVWQHLQLIAGLYDVRPWEPRATRLLEQFELLEKAGTNARGLSRGMRQKLAICCAYLYDPKAILLDEPMTGLDPHGIRQLQDSVRQRAAEGAAVMISSHLLAMLEGLCTHVLVMHRGEPRFRGTIDELRAAYGPQPMALEEAFFLATGGPCPIPAVEAATC